MIPKVMEQYADQVRPHLQSAGERACSYAERIIARLDAIHEAVQSEEFEERRRRESFPLGVGVTYPAGNVDSITVPAGEHWIIEAVTADVAAATAIRINADDRPVWFGQFAASDTKFGQGVWLASGQQLKVSNIGAGAVSMVYVQFKRERVAFLSRRTGVGLPNPLPTITEHANTARHVPSYAP